MDDIKRNWGLPLTLGPADYPIEFRLQPSTLLPPQAAQASKSSSHFERAWLPKGCQGLTPPVTRVGRSAQSPSASLLDSKHAAQWDGSGSLTTLGPSWMGGAGSSSSSGSMHAGGGNGPHQSVQQAHENGPNRRSSPSVVKSDPVSALSPTARHRLEFGNGSSSASSSASQGQSMRTGNDTASGSRSDVLWNALLLGGGASAVSSGGASQIDARDSYGGAVGTSTSGSSSSIVGGGSTGGGAKAGTGQQQQPSPKGHAVASYAVGDRVMARYHASNEWRPARVARVVPVPIRVKAGGGGGGKRGSGGASGGGGGGSKSTSAGAAEDDVWIDVIYDDGGESERALPAHFLKMDPDAVALSPGTRVRVRHRGRPQWFAAVVEGLSPVQPWIRLPPAPTTANHNGRNRVVKSRPQTPSSPAPPTSPSSPSSSSLPSSSSSSSSEANAPATSPQNWEPGLFASGKEAPLESNGGGGGGGSGGGGSRGSVGSRGSNCNSRGGGSRDGGSRDGSRTVRSVGAQGHINYGLSHINYGLSHGRICLAAEYDQTDDHRTHHVVPIRGGGSGGGGTAEDALFDEASHPGHGFGEAECFVYDVRYTHTGPDFTSKREFSVPRFLIKRDPVAQEIATPSKVTLVRAAPNRTKAREALTFLKRSASPSTSRAGPETDDASAAAAAGAAGNATVVLATDTAATAEAAAVAAAKAKADEEEARVKAQQIAMLAADFSEQTTSAKRGGRPSSSSSSSSRFAGQQTPPSGGLLSLRHGTSRKARWRTASGEEPPSPLSPYSPVIGGGGGGSAPPAVNTATASASASASATNAGATAAYTAAASTAADVVADRTAANTAANTAGNYAANNTTNGPLPPSSLSLSFSSSSSFTAVDDVANWVTSPMRPPSEPRRRSRLPVSSQMRLQGGAGFDVAGVTLGEHHRALGNHTNPINAVGAAEAAAGASMSATAAVTWENFPHPHSLHPSHPLLFAGDAGGSRLHDPRNDNLSTAHDGARASCPESAAVRNERRQWRQQERKMATSVTESSSGARGFGSHIDATICRSNDNNNRIRTAVSETAPRPVRMHALEQRLQVRAMLGSRARKSGAWRALMPDAPSGGSGSGDRQKLTVVASGDGVGVPFSPVCAQHRRPAVAAAPESTSLRQFEEGLRAGSRRSSRSVGHGSLSLNRTSMKALEGSGDGSSGVAERRSQHSFSNSDENDSDDQISIDGRSFEGKRRNLNW